MSEDPSALLPAIPVPIIQATTEGDPADVARVRQLARKRPCSAPQTRIKARLTGAIGYRPAAELDRVE
jgi:hypothetical protein